LPCQDQERDLHGVLGGMAIIKRLQTDTKNHRPVPLDQRCKRRFANSVTAPDEPLEQLAVT
jgi:hypothetical protein